MDSALFFARLSAMNWVERRVNREAAIRLGGDGLWKKLAASINDAVNSYNAHYGHESGKVECDSSSNTVHLTRVIKTNTETAKQISWQVSFDRVAASISATGYQRTSMHLMEIDAVDDGSLIVRLTGGDELSCDAASQN
jgi:hypothetical protein